jgi:hypothetical protein
MLTFIYDLFVLRAEIMGKLKICFSSINWKMG